MKFPLSQEWNYFTYQKIKSAIIFCLKKRSGINLLLNKLSINKQMYFPLLFHFVNHINKMELIQTNN